MKRLKKVSFLLLLLFFTSCKGIIFNPDFYVFDRVNKSLVNESGDVLLWESERVDTFACMSEAKIEELKTLLMKQKFNIRDKKFIAQKFSDLKIRTSKSPQGLFLFSPTELAARNDMDVVFGLQEKMNNVSEMNTEVHKILNLVHNILKSDLFILGWMNDQEEFSFLHGDMNVGEFLMMKGFLEMELFANGVMFLDQESVQLTDVFSQGY